MKQGSRRGLKRYQCKDCKAWFSLNYRVKIAKKILLDHIDGKPLRKIADKFKISKSKIARKYNEELSGLPNSNNITKQYCTRFCGILVVDGKYISIKGYERKIPLLWGLDYLTHDIPVFRLAPSESYEAWLKYFGYLKSIKYPLQIVICDDNENIKLAAKFMFPNVLVQLCQNHFLENIRKDLSVRTEEKYRSFVQDLKRELFSRKLTRADFQGKAFRLVKKYEKDIVPMQVLRKIHDNLQELTGASLVRTAPLTTNIIESFNSHLQARLKSIKKFQSFHSAGLWLNAYILRRRYKPFTDCGKKFKYLNHKSAISQTCRKNAVLPLFTM